MTKEEFATKVDWEGGIQDALDYGLHATDLDDVPENSELRRLWAALELNHKHIVRPLMEEIQELLPEPVSEE